MRECPNRCCQPARIGCGSKEKLRFSDRLLKLKVSQAQKKNPSLPEYGYAWAVIYEVAVLYHSRWKIEVGFRNLKSGLLDKTLVLRRRKVDLREVAGL